MQHGLDWDTLKIHAMNLSAPFDCIEIDLSPEDQKNLKDLIQLQENLGDVNKNLNLRQNSTKICNIPWKRLKHVVMNGDKDSNKLRIPLNNHE